MKNFSSKKYILSVFLITLLAAAVSKALFLYSSACSSDIAFIGSQSAFMKYLPTALSYISILLKQLYCAIGVSTGIYAITYYGRRTAFLAVLLSTASFAITEAGGYIYNIIQNSFESYQLIAAALAVGVEIMYVLVIFIAAVLAGGLYLKKSFTSKQRRREKLFSPAAATLVPALVSLVLQITDLTAFRIIPFLVKYGTPSSTERAQMIGDYIYCFAVNFALLFILSLLSVKLLSKITGPLKPKYNGENK